MALDDIKYDLITPITTKVGDSVEEVKEVYIKPMTVGEITSPSMKLYFTNVTKKMYKPYREYEKAIAIEREKFEKENPKEAEEERNREAAEAGLSDEKKSTDSPAINSANVISYIMKNYGYEEYNFDLNENASKFFDRQIYLDPLFTKPITTEAKEMLKSSGDLLNVYKILNTTFFFTHLYL
jgi:hypothetical protein